MTSRDRQRRLSRLERTPTVWRGRREAELFLEMTPEERDQVVTVWRELLRLDAMEMVLRADADGALRVRDDGRLVAEAGFWEPFARLMTY